MEHELFSVSAVNSLNRRFPSIEMISVFESSDLLSDVEMEAMAFTSQKEYSSSRTGSKVITASVDEKPCLLRYIDVTPNIEAQTDTLVYLSLLKSLKHR